MLKNKKEDCPNCLGSENIFNGTKFIPCPDCTDESSKDEDYQKKLSKAVSNILIDENISESKEDSLT